jgi:hypothetical protein
MHGFFLGICWAMAAVAAVECLICQTTGALVRLSVQELVDCVAGDCICVEGGCYIYGGYKECAFYYIQKRGIGLADQKGKKKKGLIKLAIKLGSRFLAVKVLRSYRQ